MEATVAELAAIAGGRVQGEGNAVIRGFAGKTLGLGHAERRRIGLPANTSVAHLRVRPNRGTVLVDYNLGSI